MIAVDETRHSNDVISPEARRRNLAEQKSKLQQEQLASPNSKKEDHKDQIEYHINMINQIRNHHRQNMIFIFLIYLVKHQNR